MLRLAAAALLLAACSVAATSEGWTPSTFPNPNKDAKGCGRGDVASSWVCDPDGVIPVESANVVEGLIQRISDGATPYVRAVCGSRRQGFQVWEERPPFRCCAHVSLPACKLTQRPSAWLMTPGGRGADAAHGGQ